MSAFVLTKELIRPLLTQSQGYGEHSARAERRIQKFIIGTPERFERFLTFSEKDLKLFLVDQTRGTMTLPSGALIYNTYIDKNSCTKVDMKIRLIQPSIKHFKLLVKQLMFTGVRVSQWFLLYHIFETNLKNQGPTRELAFLYGLLSLSASSRGRSFRDFTEHTKRVDTILVSSSSTSEVGKGKINEILETLRIPKETKGFSNVKTTEEFVINNKLLKPKEPVRIGVGYKDKGTLPQGQKELPEDDLEGYLSPSENSFFRNCSKFWNEYLNL